MELDVMHPLPPDVLDEPEAVLPPGVGAEAYAPTSPPTTNTPTMPPDQG